MQRSLDRLADRQRAKLLRIERETTDALERAHARLVADVQREIGALERDIAAAQDAGERITPLWLLRGGRLAGLLARIRSRVGEYGQMAEGLVTRGQRAMATEGADAAHALLADATDPYAARLAAAGLHPLTFDRVPTEALDALAGRMHGGRGYLTDLFRGFGEEAVSKARGLLYIATALGDNPTQIATALSKALNISRNRALVIARTEMMGAYRDASIATYRANSDVCQGWVWVAAAGACPICVDLDGSEHGLDEDFDGAHPNCFPAGTMVSGPRPVGSTTRWYVGEIVEIDTGRGNFLAVTPNHPILTPRGWVAAGCLKVGDDVICHLGRERGDTTSVASPDDDDMPAPIEQIAVTLRGAGAMRAVSMPCAAENFHGDGRGSVNGEVHVVRANGILRDAGMGRQPRRQPFAQQHLCWRHTQLAFLARLRDFDAMLARLVLPAHGGMGSLSVAPSLVGGARGSQRAIDFHRPANVDASGEQAQANGSARDTVGIRQRLLRLASDIARDDFSIRQAGLSTPGDAAMLRGQAMAFLWATTQAARLEQGLEASSADVEPGGYNLHTFANHIGVDRILNVRIRGFRGHVYNLQTTDGWYIANNIITHNCRCTSTPLTRSYDDILAAAGVA